MVRKSKRMQEIQKNFEASKNYGLTEAVEILKSCPATKFDQSIDVSIKLGVDPRKSDQQVRGTVSLPHGTGKKISVLVLANGDKVQEAKDAGADFAGGEDLIKKIKDGWLDFDTVIATPDMMREVGKLGKVLGPRGLMPSPKGGTVTMDVSKAVKEIKAGKIEFKFDRQGVINIAIGKVSFEADSIVENINTVLRAIWKAKPAALKGIYIRSMVVSSTMGPGVKIEARDVQAN